MINDHKPLSIRGFKGIYNRSAHSDDVKGGYFIDSLNTIDYGENIGTRKGFNKSVTFGAIRRAHIWKVDGQADRTLILDGNGDIFDVTASLSTPILALSGVVIDFSIISMYGRCYITPHNGVTGTAGEKVYVYNGSGLARAAAGLKPASGFDGEVSATAGNIEEGIHIFAWVYETDSGFITPPMDVDDFKQLTFDGDHAADFSSIPIGPTGTVARRLIATRTLQDPILARDGYEYFYVPDGRINNNSATTLAGVNFYDSELITSADYLFDQLEEIPAGVFISSYGTKITVGGEAANRHLVRVSKNLEPESFSSTAGFIVVDPHEEEGVKNGVEFRKAFYIFKGNPGHTYVTIDNGYEAATWVCDIVDPGIGADCHCVSEYLDSKGASADFFLVADVAGIYRFDGSYNQQIPLTYAISRLWSRINKSSIDKVEIILDPKRFLIYVLLPLNTIDSTGAITATSEFPNYILVGNYSDGLWPDKIRWHLWNSQEFNPVSLVVEINNSTKATRLKVAGRAGNIYDYDESIYNDEDLGYSNYLQFESVGIQDNFVHHYGGVGLNILGSGSLAITAYKSDLSTTVAAPSITLQANPNREFLKPLNVTNESCSIRIALSAANSYFILECMTLYHKVAWATRPG